MVEKFSSSFLGCINPCNFGWQNLSINQVVPTGIGFFESAFPNEMGECEECRIRFSLLKRKKLCNECGLTYCSSCLKRLTGGQRQCKKCNILSHWPINRAEISSLRVRDLRHFLGTCKISTNTCREKQDLIDLVIVQLKIKHLGRSREFHQNFTRPESDTSSSGAAPISDDGIRVRPHHGFSQPSSSAVPPPVAEEESEDAGIRVFASSQCPEGTGPSGSDQQQQQQQQSTNVDTSDNSSSSSWSLLQSEGGQDGSSSDSLSQSLPSENYLSNLPASISSNVVEEIAVTDTSLSDERSEGNPQETPPATDAQNISNLESKMTTAANVVKLSSLETEESIKGLSVRQCKEILTLHRVDFSGVWEKHELVGKVKMLWRDYRQRLEEGELSEAQLCKICMDAAMDCVLLECGHIVSCTECGKQMAECPICRQNVIRVVKTFRA